MFDVQNGSHCWLADIIYIPSGLHKGRQQRNISENLVLVFSQGRFRGVHEIVQVCFEKSGQCCTMSWLHVAESIGPVSKQRT
jgi:hypothetical protein